jgi:hypothetical protein
MYLPLIRLVGLAFHVCFGVRPQPRRSESEGRALLASRDDYRAALGRWAERIGLGQDDIAAWRGHWQDMSVTVASGPFEVELLLDGDVPEDAFDHPALVRAIHSIERVEGELVLRFAPDVHPDVLEIAIRVAREAMPPASPPEPSVPYR